MLRVEKDLVPEPRLEVALHLWQVKVRPTAARHELPRVVEKVHPKVEESTGDGLAVDDEVRLGEVPPSRANGIAMPGTARAGKRGESTTRLRG